MVLQTIAHGEPNWDAKVNALIASVNGQDDKLASQDNKLDAISGIKVGQWVNSGFVFMNGFRNHDNQTAYRWIKFPGGSHLIELVIKSELGTAKNGYYGGDWVVLPNAIIPASWQLNGTISSMYFYSQNNDRTLGISKGTDGDWNVGGYVYAMHTMYFIDD